MTGVGALRTDVADLELAFLVMKDLSVFVFFLDRVNMLVFNFTTYCLRLLRLATIS